MSAVKKLFTFPDPVNETAVRVTATGVVVMAATALVTQRPEILVVIAYGFLARALTGPRLSPLALLSVRVITPRLDGPHRLVAGPPKRFAQALGAGGSVAAVLCYYAFGWHLAAWVLAGMMVVLATLEAAFRICVGCMLYAALIRRGVIDGANCPECADIRLRSIDRVSV
ncbi:MAG: DUF4395 domain-containing protein [Actinomycetes bacterium]